MDMIGTECSSSDLIDKNELIRLIGAALKHLGLEKSVSALESETLLQVNSGPARKLRECILSGNWEEGMQLLGELVPLESGASYEVKCVRYALLKQRTLELIKEGKELDALASLREMTALGLNFDEVAKVTRFLLPWVQLHVPDRADLLPQLEKFLPPGDFVEKRLLELVKQALVSQIKGCKYHNVGPQKMSLFRDHDCGINHMPSKKLQAVRAHDGAICHLRFSKKGDFLASCDVNEAKVWRVCRGRLILAHVLRGPIANICWDWEGVELLTCGEGGARRWVSGECIGTLAKNGVAILSCSYSKHGTIFTSNEDDSVSEWTLEGIESKNWADKPTWTKNIETTSNSEVVLGSDPNTLSIFNSNSSVEERLEESSFILFYALSSKHDKIIISLDDKIFSVWDIESRTQMMLIHSGFDMEGICFGGIGDGFAAAAARDNKVRIWHLSSGELICTLGHESPVGCVCWNGPTMLVSGGEDGLILLWGPESELADDEDVQPMIGED